MHHNDPHDLKYLSSKFDDDRMNGIDFRAKQRTLSVNSQLDAY